MSDFDYEYSEEELNQLLDKFKNLMAGAADSFIEEDGFELIISHYEDQNAYKTALEVANTALDQYPVSQNILYMKCNLLLYLQRYNEALRCAEEFISIEEELVGSILLLRIEALLALGRMDDAMELVEDVRLLTDEEEKIEIFFELADIFDECEESEKVFDCIYYILSIDPNNEEGLYKICFWTDFTGRCEESIKLHKSIVEDFPYNALAWFNLATAYQGVKLHEKAIEAYQFALAIDETFEHAHRNLGDAYLRLRKYPEAIEALQGLLLLATPEAVIFEAIGHCYDKLRQYNLARNFYKKASLLNVEDGQMPYKIALTHMNESEWKSAIKYLMLARNKSKLQPEYNLALGQCYMEMENYEEAMTCLGSVVRTRPKNMNGWMELLRCLYLSGLSEDGVAYAQFAWEQTDRKPIFLFYKSLFLFEEGQIDEALAAMEIGMSENPRLIKKIITLNPSIIQHREVVELIARYKKRKTKR